jgi:EAL domain-containing protein (putative c-di-GMP-specific phosphodiesterase class I)/ActR/RegA family two-component response regulator
MRQLRILIVDDDPELCRVACWILESMATCAVAHDLASAARQLDREPFDLVLIDVALQGESGLSLLDELQQRWPDTAATMISGTDNLDVAQTALTRGALAYLVKPFRVNDLRIQVATVCATHRRVRFAGRSSPRTRIVAEMESMFASGARVMCAVVEFQQLPLVSSAGTVAGEKLGSQVEKAVGRLADLHLVGSLGNASFVLAGRCAPDPSMTDAAALVRAAIDSTARASPAPGQFAPRFVVGVSVRSDDAERLLTEAEASARSAFEEHLPAVVFTSELGRAAGEELRLLWDLSRAIEQREIYLAYQPQYLATSRRIIGVEALARWHHPARGDVPPSIFVPVAESSGLIDLLGEQVLRAACRDAATMGRSPVEGPRVSVNVSVAQLRDPHFVDTVVAALTESCLPASRLCLEVTESLVLDDSEQLASHFERLSAHGIRLSLDDFGTGFSTFESLSQFPWSELKVDSVLTAQFERRCGREILRSIVAMASKLDLDVVAEGVESTGQFEALQALGFGMMQGFLLRRPIPIDELRQDLVRRTSGSWPRTERGLTTASV